MADDFSKLPVDDTLTVHTADERGYRHVIDYDQATLYDLRADISRMLKEEGYRLGRPRYFWPEKGKEQDTGLYEPLQRLQVDRQEKK